jgi:hypothetical protein
LAEEPVFARYEQRYLASPSAGSTVGLQSGIGFNSTTTASGIAPSTNFNATSSNMVIGALNVAEHSAVPFVGVNVLTALEGATPSGPVSNGGEANMRLFAQWRG